MIFIPAAVTVLTITEARSSVMSFSNPIDDIFHSVFIQNPIDVYNYDAYTSPLADEAWLMFLIWALVTPPILYILARWKAITLQVMKKLNHFVHFRYGELDQNINELTFPKTYVMVFGTFTQRGYSGVPTTWKARIAFTRCLKFLELQHKHDFHFFQLHVWWVALLLSLGSYAYILPS